MNKLLIYFILAIMLLYISHQASAFFDDFESGKIGADWKKSPVGQDASWSVNDGSLQFNGVGGQSQMMTGEDGWKDYTVECDVRLTLEQEWPGGIRTYVNQATGGHYAVWVYPVQKMIKLYSGIAWDINVGLVSLGEFRPFEPEMNEFFYLKVAHTGKNIEVSYGPNKDKAKVIIEADDDTFKSGLFACDGWDKPIHFDNILITGPGIPKSEGEKAVKLRGKMPSSWGELKNLYK